MNNSFGQDSPGWMSGSVECRQLPSAVATQIHDNKIITDNNCLHNYCSFLPWKVMHVVLQILYYIVHVGTKHRFLSVIFLFLFSKDPLVMAGHLHHWNTISQLFLQALRLQFKFIRQVTLTVSEKCYFLQLIIINVLLQSLMVVKLIWVQNFKSFN